MNDEVAPGGHLEIVQIDAVEEMPSDSSHARADLVHLAAGADPARCGEERKRCDEEPECPAEDREAEGPRD